MDLNDRAISFCLELEWADLPEQVRRQAKRCLLDVMGALIAGTQTPVGRLMAEFSAGQLGGDEAFVPVSGQRCSVTGAALATGFAANALDIDDGHRLVKGHPGACLAPVLLAAVQTRDVTGAEFLAALVVGYELAIRAGIIRHAVYPTYHSSGSWGAVAGAAVAGRIMGLDRADLYQALGAAEYHAPIAPMMKGIVRPGMVKDSIGWGCLVALSSAIMAGQGFTGIEPLFGDSPDPAWVTDLGHNYRIMDLYFKPYAACRWGQPAVAGALALKERHGLAPDDIARIRVRTFTEAVGLDNSPPPDTERAQYNLAWPVAAALTDGRVGPAQVLPPRLFDPDLIALAARVEVEAAEEFDQVFPAQALAETIITTQDGQSLSSEVLPAKWEPPDSPTDDELAAKFRWLAEPVIGGRAADELAEFIRRLDEADSVRPLINLTLKTA